MKLAMSRRSFLRLTALAPAAGILPRPAGAREPVYRTLGRTGLKVSEVGMGVMLTSDPAIVRAALDGGINYFDTARAYMGGRNEEVLGKGLLDRRKEAIVATKCHRLGNVKTVVATVETSLRALGTDVIDILQLHGLSSRSQVFNEANLEALDRLRRQGKIRFAGVTTHANMVEVMDAAVEAKVFDTVLTSFNFQSPAQVVEAIRTTSSAGLGVIAMKIMTGGYRAEVFPGLNPYQSALRWVLTERSVATTIPSMATLRQFEENVAVMGSTLSWRDDLSLTRYASVVGGRYCRACGDCLGLCPLGADIPAAMRAVMYAEGYGEERLGRLTAASLGLPCGGCGSCLARCSFGIDLPRRIAAALDLAAGNHA